jgi:hypothetical protein
MCLDFRCKVKKFDSNRPFLAVIETLLPHRVRRGTMMMINLVGFSPNYFSIICDLNSCLPGMINQLELDAKT